MILWFREIYTDSEKSFSQFSQLEGTFVEALKNFPAKIIGELLYNFFQF